MSAANTDHAPPMPALSPAQRRWSLAAAISCTTVFGAGVGLSAPLLSLVLEGRGTGTTLTGLNAAATFLGVVLGPLLTARLLGRVGLLPFMSSCLVLDAALFPLLKLSDSIAAWFVIRFLLGVVGSSTFTAAEAWIITIASDAERGRIIGFYGAALSAGFAVGPLLLSLTGIDGWLPFLANALIIALATLPLLLSRATMQSFQGRPGFSPLAVFAKAPLIMLAVAMFGAYEGAAISLLPVWGKRIGLDVQTAAALLTTLYFGSIALQIPIGWLSDRFDRFAALRLCGAVGMIGAALLPFLSGTGMVLFAVMFLWGGITCGLYPVALSIAGDRFRGADIVAANAALITGYGLGSLAGPALGGVAMDLWNPHGLFALFVSVFAIFLLATQLRRRPRGF